MTRRHSEVIEQIELSPTKRQRAVKDLASPTCVECGATDTPVAK